MNGKLIPTLAVALLAAAAMPITAFAHNHSGVDGDTWLQCSIADCNLSKVHQHENIWYTGHTSGDGHDYHQVCTVENCIQTGSHDHDGVICLPHNNGDGHQYHRNGETGRRH